MVNPIEAAVLPLKADAAARAEKEARELVERIFANLEAVGWDQEKYAPLPSYGLPREEYGPKMALYALVGRLTRWTQSSRRPKEPCIVEPHLEGVEQFVEAQKRDAEIQYDRFVAKLVAKIGDCESAVLEGDHVWHHSFLTVAKRGVSEVWKTQIIVNQSKYARPFYQWPTRKVKAAL